MDRTEVENYYQQLNSEELILIAQNQNNEYEEEAVEIAKNELKKRGIADTVTVNQEREITEQKTMDTVSTAKTVSSEKNSGEIQYETIDHYLTAAALEISKLSADCKNKTTHEEDMATRLEQTINLLSAAYNLRHYTLQDALELS